MENRIHPQQRISRLIIWGILTLVILFVAAIRIRLLALPLERDEGEYAYIGQLLLHGIMPWKLAYSMKLPGTSASYALIMAVFGQTASGIHLGLVLLNAATTALAFLLAKRLMDDLGALVAAATFALLSVSPAIYGTAAHAAHFVLLPALAGFLVLFRALERNGKWTFFTAGLLFGLAFLMKQSGIFFGIFAGVYLIYHEVRGRGQMPWRSLAVKCGLYFLGAALPFVSVCVMFYLAETFESFWFWIFSYAREYGGMESINQGFDNLTSGFEGVIRGGCLLWVLAGLGIIQLFLGWKNWPNPAFTAGLLLFSFFSVCPGLYFRNHYFILLLPAAGVAVGLMVNGAQSWFSKTTPYRFVPVVMFIGVWGYSFFQQKDILLQLPPAAACREMYAANPFPEAVEIAKYLKAQTTSNETIAILGSEPEICFYADRRSATGYIYMYPLTESQPYELQMQRQMIQEIETTKPAYIVLVGIITSWNSRSPSSHLIFDWFNPYSRQNLEPVGLVNILSPTQTDYYWKTEDHALPPRSDVFLEVFKRKSAVTN